MVELALTGMARRAPAPAATPAVAIAGRALCVEVLTGASAFADLRAEWQALAERQRSAILFQTPDLLAAWSRHFAPDRENFLVTVVVRREGRPVLIWPLCMEHRGLVRVARGAGAPIGQYDEILLDPDCDAKEAVALATEALMQAARPDVVVLERVRADGALRAALTEAQPLAAPEGAPYSDISQGIAELLAGLKPRVVRQQKKRVKRFDQQGCVAFEVAAQSERAVAWLAEAMALKRAWLRSTGRLSRAFVKPATADCLAELARALARPDASPRMVVSRLTLDGRTAAIEMGFCHRGAYHLYLGAFAEDFAKFGPGNILTERILGWCAANGVGRYDMMAPRSRNKSEWQSGEVEVLDFAIPTTMRGRLYVAAVLRRLVPALRSAFYALPPSIRSAVAGLTLRI